MTTETAAAYDGCSRECSEGHTYIWSRCELGIQPSPMLQASRTYIASDGELAGGFDTFPLALFLPWAVHLPAVEQHQMLAELADTPDWKRPPVLAAWRATAEALAEPARRDVLLGEFNPADFVEVDRPESVPPAGDAPVCSTPCDPDCDAVCHESHVAGHKKQHWPYDCPAADDYVWDGDKFTDAAIKRLRAERDDARRQLAAANARVQHAETEQDQAYRSRDASSTVHRRLIKEARAERDRARESVTALGDPETEVRYLLADGTESEFDPHNGPCDCVRQTRLVHEGPWLASGGWAHLANGTVRWDIGCVFPMPSRAGVEAGRAVTIKMRSPGDAKADTEPGGSFWADLSRRLRDEPEFRKGYIQTSRQIQALDDAANGDGPFRDGLRDQLVTTGMAAAEQWLAARANRRMSDINKKRLIGHIINALWEQIEQAAIGMAEHIAEGRERAEGSQRPGPQQGD